MKRSFAGLFFFAGMLGGLCNQTVLAKATVNGFDLEAHRGGRDARPENTLFSFAYALELGVQTLELDLQLTKDGRLVVSHNPFMSPDLARGPDGSYVKAGEFDLRTMTLEEIRRFEVGRINPASDYYKLHGQTQTGIDGARIPTLEEVFELVRAYGNTTVTFNLETKSYPDPLDPAHVHNPEPTVFVRTLLEVVKKYGLSQRVFLQSFDWRTLIAMHVLDPNITLVALSSEQPSWGREGLSLRRNETAPSPWLGGLNIHDFAGDVVRAAHAVHADIISPYWEELSPELVREAHTLGMKVVPWTVNEPEAMNRLIAMNVDGIITDRPWLLRPILGARGFALPAPTVNPRSAYHTGIEISSRPVTAPAAGNTSAH